MTNQQNIDTEPAGQTQLRRNWNRRDIFFIIAPVICIILVPLGGLGYIRGRFFPFFRESFFLYVAIGCFIVYCIMNGFTRLFTHRKNHTRKKRFFIAVEISISIIFILSCISLFFMPFETFFSPACKPFMYGFRDRIKSRADIEAIRDWLRTLDNEDLEYYSQHSHSNELPESVKAIGGFAGFSTDQNGNHIIRNKFGGGLDYWGVEIGAEDMEIPPSDYVSRAGYRMYVEPGFNIVAW